VNKYSYTAAAAVMHCFGTSDFITDMPAIILSEFLEVRTIF
jgi:hypothetical protein